MPRRATKTLATRTTTARRKRVNLRIEGALYRTLQVLAQQERRSVPQTALHLLEAGLRQRVSRPVQEDDTPSHEIAALAAIGAAFDWLRKRAGLV